MRSIYLINKEWCELYTYDWLIPSNTIDDIMKKLNEINKLCNGVKCILIASCGDYGDFIISPVPLDRAELGEKLTYLMDRY